MPRECGRLSEQAFMGCENVKLHVYKNSAAHLYALQQNLSYVLYDETVEDSGITAVLSEGPYYTGESIYIDLTVPDGSQKVRLIRDGSVYSTYTVSSSLSLRISTSFSDS